MFNQSPHSCVALRLVPSSAGNSLTRSLVEELRGAVGDQSVDPSVKTIVIVGTDTSFCSGMDLDEAAELDDLGSGASAFFHMLCEVRDAAAVTIAVVQAGAIGGGVGLAAACDLVVADRKATFRLPELLWGLLPACVAPFIDRRIGSVATNRLALTAETVSAHDAVALGLIDFCVDDPAAHVQRLAQRVDLVPKEALVAMKAYRSQLDRTPAADVGRLAVETLAGRIASPVVREGLERFRSGGEPPWNTSVGRCPGAGTAPAT